jgi:hypothetical protein
VTRRGPDFDELVGPEVTGEERAQMRRAHDLLVAAGPPAELPDALDAPHVRPLTRRRVAAIALAAALATSAFAGGWALRGGDESFEVRAEVPMRATAHAEGASALIKLGNADELGNWPMEIVVRGLKPLPEGGYYELMLTKKGQPIATCGSFKVRATGETVVRLGASYELSDFDGWVVRPYIHDRDAFNKRILLTT